MNITSYDNYTWIEYDFTYLFLLLIHDALYIDIIRLIGRLYEHKLVFICIDIENN